MQTATDQVPEQELQEQELQLTPQQMKEAMDNETKYLKQVLPLWRLRHEKMKLMAEISHYQTMDYKAKIELAYMQTGSQEDQQQPNAETGETGDTGQTLQSEVQS